jgi:Na+-transporting NADH:ubiquinone oxidoreductase subunit C
MKFNIKSPVYVMVYAAVVSALFTAAIMTLHAATQHIVERNEQLARMSALVSLFDFGDPAELSDERVEELFRKHIVPMEGDLIDPETGINFNDPQDPRLRTYKAYTADPDAGGELMGYAFPVWGIGFWARIDGLMGISPDGSRNLGIVFLQHQETPGLGGRITEPRFRKEFEGLNLAPPEEGDKYIYISKQPPNTGDPAYGRHVDSITGATGTSNAVEDFLNLRIRQFRRAAQAGGLLRETDSEGGD